MKRFIQKKLHGMFEIDLDIYSDDRGYLLKLLNSEFLNFTDNKKINQVNLSLTNKKHTIRGLHFQKKPYDEYKLVSCLIGKVFDVVIDLRKDSKTYLQWDYVELDSTKKNLVIIPEGCAHGFQTLEESSQLIYFHTNDYKSEFEDGVRFDDPLININWPYEPSNISTRDLGFKNIRI
jgi:dTDP-4-dehydrorhamnose 3,5-epimerase